MRRLLVRLVGECHRSVGEHWCELRRWHRGPCVCSCGLELDDPRLTDDDPCPARENLA